MTNKTIRQIYRYLGIHRLTKEDRKIRHADACCYKSWLACIDIKSSFSFLNKNTGVLLHVNTHSGPVTVQFPAYWENDYDLKYDKAWDHLFNIRDTAKSIHHEPKETVTT